MHRGHDLAVALLPRGPPRQRRAEAGALAGQLRLAGLLEKDADAAGVRNGRPAECDAVISHQHGEPAAKRLRERAALVLADRSLIIRRQLEDAYPVTRKARVTYSGSGYRDGYAQGQRADIGTSRLSGARGRSLTRAPVRQR